MKVEFSQLVFFKKVVIENGRKITELSGWYLEVFVEFLSGLWVIGLKNGYSQSMETVPGGDAIKMAHLSVCSWEVMVCCKGGRCR